MNDLHTLNGLNRDELNDSINGLRNNPNDGRFTFRAKNKWVTGAHCKTSIKDFSAAEQEGSHRKTFLLEGDEPEGLLGTDKGANATEALLHALAACLNAAFIYHATARGIKIDEFEIDIEGDINVGGFLGANNEVRNGFEQIRATFKVKSDAPIEAIEELCQCAQDRSPVYDCVTHEVPVAVNLQVHAPASHR